MKKLLLVLVCFVMMTAGAHAQTPYGVSFGYGESNDNIDIYRIGLQKDWGVKWLENATGYVNGYFELSYNYWEKGGDKIHGVALSPVFKYEFNPGGAGWYPYIEGGIGVALLNDTTIGKTDMSSNFQFEDRIGIGYRFNNFDLNFRYMHYSNAGLKKPNDGIDIWMGTLAWYF